VGTKGLGDLPFPNQSPSPQSLSPLAFQFVNLRIRTFRTSPKAASVAIIDEPP
jgi:hypothetical protein